MTNAQQVQNRLIIVTNRIESRNNLVREKIQNRIDTIKSNSAKYSNK